MTDRADYITGLRQLADVLEAHPEAELPADGTRLPLSWGLWGDDAREQMAAVARAIPCAWRKETRDADPDGKWAAYFDLSGELAGLRLKITAYRHAVCTRTVTGTRQVTEEVPDPGALAAVPVVTVTREVEDVTWDCSPILAGQVPS